MNVSPLDTATGVVTVTEVEELAPPAGATTVTDVAVSDTICAGVVPKSTAEAEPRLTPPTVTVVPPLAGPLDGLIVSSTGVKGHEPPQGAK